MLHDILTARAVPALRSRAEMLEILQREEYGYLPPKSTRMEWSVQENCIPSFCAGKVTARRVELTVYLGDTPFTFPFVAVIPKSKEPCPFFIHINFRPDVPDRYMPTEEITDNGFAVLSFCYTDVTSDNGDFTNGLAGVLYPDGKRKPTDPGKIALWAWAAQRVLDYAEQEPRLDMSRAMVCGHSRLGKTALLCGATDERFFLAHSNDSGCSGAAITREKTGERVEQITRNFPYWFCENYKKYIGKEADMPFDQHYLIASIAPRYTYVASALEDSWADPASELLSCMAATPAYEAHGLAGMVCADRLPEAGDEYHEGSIGYHLRPGLHYFGREDWNRLMTFVKGK